MKAGIIAAGLGSRLSQSRALFVKALVPVAGTPLCHWVVGALGRAGFCDVAVVHNSAGREVRKSLTTAFPNNTWSFLERDTASSWETFRLLARALAVDGSPFLISTVDAIVPAAEIARFARLAREAGADAALALTDFIDDEKPLWADLSEDGLRIAALGEDARQRRHATAGLYYFTPAVAAAMPPAESHSSLRGYLTGLVSGGARVAGVALSKTIDVDRPEDVAVAEKFLKEADGKW